MAETFGYPLLREWLGKGLKTLTALQEGFPRQGLLWAGKGAISGLPVAAAA